MARRLSPPELRHAHWAQTVTVGILQQLGGTAVTGPGRGSGMHGVGEDVREVALLAKGVEHAVLSEQPPLQVIAHLAATAALCVLNCTLQNGHS